MAKRTSALQAQLAAVRALRSEFDTTSAIPQLRNFLSASSNQLVAEAALICGEFGLLELEDDLVRAFHRLRAQPLKSDPTCVGKTAIAEALVAMEAYQEALYLEGVGYVQPEPVWGGRQDTAGKLRAVCLMGLARSGYEQVLDRLADLLADPEPDARMGAARAALHVTTPGTAALLRLRLQIGDPEPPVMQACAAVLLEQQPEALPLVAARLADPDVAQAEAAALAIGEAAPPGAFDLLSEAWSEAAEIRLRRTLLVALAMLRDPAALEFLLALPPLVDSRDLDDLIAAMNLYRHDDQVWQRFESALEQAGR